MKPRIRKAGGVRWCKTAEHGEWGGVTPETAYREWARLANPRPTYISLDSKSLELNLRYYDYQCGGHGNRGFLDGLLGLDEHGYMGFN